MKFVNVMAAGILFVSSSAAWGQCAITITAVNFGGYDSYTQLDATGSVNINCDVGLNYIIRIDAGSNSGGGFTPRSARLAGSPDTMSYNLYRDSARTEVWGDGTNSTFVRTGAGIGAEEMLIVYGRLPAGQNIALGVYSDALTVTIEW